MLAAGWSLELTLSKCAPAPLCAGAPLLQSSTQVGLTSGPGCDGTDSDYGAFVKLADKGVLEQVWARARLVGACPAAAAVARQLPGAAQRFHLLAAREQLDAVSVLPPGSCWHVAEPVG